MIIKKYNDENDSDAVRKCQRWKLNGNVVLRACYTQRYSQNIQNYYNQKIFLKCFEIILEIF